MTSDLIEILITIVEGIHKNHSVERILQSVNRTKKVNKNLIAAIYSWIFEKISRDIEEKIDNNPDSSGIRFLSEEEIETIGLDNYNYILHLYNLGLLNNADIEKILVQVLSFEEGELKFEQLNFMILSIFLEANADLPPGSRLLLYSSDTIN